MSAEVYESFAFGPDDDILLKWVHSTRAHQQPLTCLVIEAGMIATGSQVGLHISCLFDLIGISG